MCQIFITLNSFDEMMEIACCNMQLCKIDMDNHLHCGKWYRIALSYHINNGIGHFRWRCCLQKNWKTIVNVDNVNLTYRNIPKMTKLSIFCSKLAAWRPAYVYFWRHPDSIQFYKSKYSLRKNVLMWYAREGSKGSFFVGIYHKMK